MGVAAVGAHPSGGPTVRGKKGGGLSTFQGDGGVRWPGRVATRSYSRRRRPGRRGTGPIGVSELRGAAHRGGVDGAAADNDSGGSVGASATVVDQRKEGGGSSRGQGRRENRGGKERARWCQGDPFIPARGDRGWTGRRCHVAARSAGGARRCTRVALSAGSNPTAVGAGGRCLHAQPAPNRGEARADRWPPATVSGDAVKYGLNRFKNI
jgi:hypothetical protein